MFIMGVRSKISQIIPKPLFTRCVIGIRGMGCDDNRAVICRSAHRRDLFVDSYINFQSNY